MPPPTAGTAQTRAELTALRPDLVAAYDAALPGARAAILERLRKAIDREPLPPAAGHTNTTDPVELVETRWPGSRLTTEIDNSVANLALARANARPGEMNKNGTLGEIEQSLVDGHPLHPCCRTRAGMTVADVLAYAPEHRTVIRLRRLRVPAERWYGGGQPILYAHPWQAARLMAQYPWLQSAGVTRPVRPLMSLRTVAPISGGPHIKTAVDVQMTSAVRTVSPAAVHNGPILSTLLQTITADLPIDILAETAAGAVITDDGPDRRAAHLIREAPKLAPGETAVPLGVLATWKRAGDPYPWVEKLGRVLFAPLARVLERGVALEAHGQNTILVLRGDEPQRVLYRDLGGVRVHAGRLRAAGLDTPELIGDLPTGDETALRTKLAAAALGTVATQIIDGLDADPATLWQTLATAMRADPSADTEALLSEPLPVKATTAMRLADDPLQDIWTHQHNPMAA
ncbi:siderophore synthetase component [Actinoplanes lutulentus]|uniref:Siderophore synthetase component n=1 Tax=Actinoplanes lutulentus TaxID=1287878 RepID=A0A327Z527_9ACTN|nr:IucA/IucC family siderophore biosynthesis protein [Actinoplanes lutulentus]MBB2948174.1 siderophore synthetase component [Actinoplanes lutulentus]RAK31326.1 siderophore synthetase component [Actinoplanes lutulentus]